MRFEMLLRLDAAVRLADGQIRVTAEQVEGNFLVVIEHGFFADPVKAGHGFPFSENRMVQRARDRIAQKTDAGQFEDAAQLPFSRGTEKAAAGSCDARSTPAFQTAPR